MPAALVANDPTGRRATRTAYPGRTILNTPPPADTTVMKRTPHRRADDPSRARRLALAVDIRWLTTGALLLGLVAVFPHAQQTLAASNGLLPAFIALVVVANTATAVLLASQFRSSGEGRTLALVAPFLLVGAVAVPYSLVLPGVWQPGTVVHAPPDAARWLWTFWRAGAALLLGAACAPWPNRRPLQPVRVDRRTGPLAGVVLGVAALVTVGTHLAFTPDELPVYDAGAIHPYVVGAAVVTAALAAWWSMRVTTPARWLVVVATADLCDVLLTYRSNDPSSVAWNVAHLAALVAALALLGAMTSDLARLYRKLAASDDQLTAQTLHDGLTGLLNRGAAYEQICVLVRIGRPLVLVVFDIDRFKHVNDVHGHTAGDSVLTEVARRLASGVRDGDIVSRWGGEQFVVVLPGTLAGGRRAAERLLEQVRSEVVLLGEGARAESAAITLSAGLSVVHSPGPGLGPAAGDDAHALDEALRRADLALYRAKAAGRDQLVDAV